MYNFSLSSPFVDPSICLLIAVYQRHQHQLSREILQTTNVLQYRSLCCSQLKLIIYVWPTRVLFGLPDLCLSYQSSACPTIVMSGIPEFSLAYQSYVCPTIVLSDLPEFCLAYQRYVWSTRVLSGVKGGVIHSMRGTGMVVG